MSNQSEQQVRLTVTEPVATIVLNRPQRGNALTARMVAELSEALGDAYQEKRVRAVVLTGAGERFCSGRDVGELLGTDQPPADPEKFGQEAGEYRDLLLQMLRLPKPIVASVNGPAGASGAGLVLASDLVVGCRQAAFGLPDGRLGLVAGVAAPLLAYRLGAGLAARLVLGAQMLPAREALRVGVYHELVERDLLWARAAEIGAQCAAAAPQAASLAKQLLMDTAGEQLATQLTSGAIAAATSRTTEAAVEGLTAFVEKRPPAWIAQREGAPPLQRPAG